MLPASITKDTRPDTQTYTTIFCKACLFLLFIFKMVKANVDKQLLSITLFQKHWLAQFQYYDKPNIHPYRMHPNTAQL